MIQSNADAASDLLYTCNFAFVALHEAAAATGDPFYREAEEKLATFLCRIQIRSETHPELDGGWFRAFDFKRWEYWASNTDAGWGAWCIESGWTQSWITSVLALRQMNTSLWDLTKASKVNRHFPTLREEMLPDEVLKSLEPKKVQHAALGKPVKLATPYSENYAGNGAALTDGLLGGTNYLDPAWLGFLGNDLVATIDLGDPIAMVELRASFLQEVALGIFMPRQVEFLAGDDPAKLTPLRTVTPATAEKREGKLREELIARNLNLKARYLQVRAANLGNIPAGHQAAGQKAWLFVDEIFVNFEKETLAGLATIVRGQSELALAGEPPAATPGRYEGRFCAGAGDVEFLRLIDESFAFFHPNPVVPNLTMLYQARLGHLRGRRRLGSLVDPEQLRILLRRDAFSSGALVLHAAALLGSLLGQPGRRQAQGPVGAASRRTGSLSSLGGPRRLPGRLRASRMIIAYKQGDGDMNVHDWFYEATAAGVVMQAEILLASRDPKAIAHYLPKMERACDFIEKARDPKNNLFLVGPACNLLAPSYGGVKQPDGSFGKGYLAGLSITYLAALDRMVELYKLAGDKEKLAEYERRQKITRESLPQLLTPAGYFVKSIEPGGIKHGVLGQKQFGYLEGVANADAVALRVADDQTAESIYRQIAAFPAIRPFDFLLTNAPGLDDTYWNWGHATGRDWRDSMRSAIGSTAGPGAPSRAGRSWCTTVWASSRTSAARPRGR